VIEQSIILGKTKGLSPDFVSKIFKAIHQESINNQTEIINRVLV
jgi:chorismate mutase